MGKWWESEAEGYVDEEEGAFEPDEPDEAPLRRRGQQFRVSDPPGAQSRVCVSGSAVWCDSVATVFYN